MPTRKSEYAAYPTPKTAIPLMAPDMMAQVQQTIDQHPEIDTMDEEARGEIIDITDWRVNGGVDRPWGRKARNNDPSNPNLNTDGMTYLRPDGLFEIYDCISGTNGQATWDGYGPFAQGENGYWWPPQPVADQPEPPPDSSELAARVAALEQAVVGLDDEVSTLTARVADLEVRVATGLHAHGPIDLPIVLESLTSLRCKGDIDVAVMPGLAMPPSDEPQNPPGLLTLAVLKRVLERRDLGDV
jgi:hypothetical protein